MLHATSFLRASDDDRERTVAFLNEQCAQGRLTLDDLDSRIEGTYRAVTVADLDALTHDLPGSPFSPAAPAAGGGLTPRRLPTGIGLGLFALVAVTFVAVVPAEVWAPLLLLAVPLVSVVLFAVAPIVVPLLLIAWMLDALSPRRRW